MNLVTEAYSFVFLLTFQSAVKQSKKLNLPVKAKYNFNC